MEAGSGDVKVTVALPPAPASVGIARAVVGAVADRAAPAWGDRVRLAVSELVTNAIVHATTDIEVQARLADSVLRVEVHDRVPCDPPDERPSSFEQLHGWGLAIVEMAVGAWDWQSHAAGKAVWFEVPLSLNAEW